MSEFLISESIEKAVVALLKLDSYVITNAVGVHRYCDAGDKPQQKFLLVHCAEPDIFCHAGVGDPAIYTVSLEVKCLLHIPENMSSSGTTQSFAVLDAMHSRVCAFLQSLTPSTLDSQMINAECENMLYAKGSDVKIEQNHYYSKTGAMDVYARVKIPIST